MTNRMRSGFSLIDWIHYRMELARLKASCRRMHGNVPERTIVRKYERESAKINRRYEAGMPL